MKESKKVRLFISEYLKDLNGTAAAIRAGYSEKTAYSIASELLTKPEIREEIERLMQERQKRLGIEADEIIQHIAQIAFATPEDFGRWTDYSPRLSDKIRALELLARHIIDRGDPSKTEQGREVLLRFKAKEIDARDAGIDLAILGLPLPDVIRIELQRAKEPDAPMTGTVMSDDELDRITEEEKAKALAWKENELPKRRANVARLERELTGDSPKLAA